MEQLVRVKKINDDGTAQVVHIRESACSGDCHTCSGCGAAKQNLYFTANNPIGAQVGDQVIVHSPSTPVLLSALVFYLLPVVVFIGMYLMGKHLWDMGLAAALAGLILWGICVVLYDRKFLKKRNIQYTIVAFGGKRFD